MAGWTLAPHHRGGVCQAEEAAEKTGGVEVATGLSPPSVDSAVTPRMGTQLCCAGALVGWGFVRRG